jgi:Flp pilus assembly secretin CpaC
MTRIRMLTVCAALVLSTSSIVAGQEKSKPEPAENGPQLKGQILLTEREGTKEIASLPYTLYVTSGEGTFGERGASLRMGARVPITIDKQNASSIQYEDVGTNIDCQAKHLEDGRFKLRISTERSSVYAPDGQAKGEVVPSNLPAGPPILRQFRGFTDLLIRDGQTINVLVGADPGSGHVLNEAVTVTVEK